VAEGLLIIRVVVGGIMAAHGLQKLFGWWGGAPLSVLGASFERSGYAPGMFFACVAATSELVSGVLIGIGFLSIFGAAMLVGVMVNAASMHWANGLWITNKGCEYTLVLGGVALGLGFTGPGRLSIDHALGLDAHGVAWGVVAGAIGVVTGLLTLAWRRGRRRPTVATPAHPTD
jgi:putative oxidoreductase